MSSYAQSIFTYGQNLLKPSLNPVINFNQKCFPELPKCDLLESKP